jgi:hypothetical protein
MTPEQLEATPPSRVDLEVVSVDPETDAGAGPVRVVARVLLYLSRRQASAISSPSTSRSMPSSFFR